MLHSLLYVVAEGRRRNPAQREAYNKAFELLTMTDAETLLTQHRTVDAESLKSDDVIEVSIKGTVQSLIMLCFRSLGKDCILRESSYEGTILQRNYKKMTMEWSFSYNSLVKFNYEKFGSSNMTMLYPNLSQLKVQGSPFIMLCLGSIGS